MNTGFITKTRENLERNFILRKYGTNMKINVGSIQ